MTPLIDPWPSDYDIDIAGHLVNDLLLSKIPRA
jgi:hypothetical protein